MNKILCGNVAKVLLILVLYGSTISFAQSSSVKLLPTGRSLPDDIPRSEYVYVGPADQESSDVIIEPQDIIEPFYTPEEIQPKNFDSSDDTLDIVDENTQSTFKYPRAVDKTPPRQGMNDIPRDIIGTYPQESPALIPDSIPDTSSIVSTQPEYRPDLFNESEKAAEIDSKVDPGPEPSKIPPPFDIIYTEPLSGLDIPPTEQIDDPTYAKDTEANKIDKIAPQAAMPFPPLGYIETEPENSILVEPTTGAEFEPTNKLLVEPSGNTELEPSRGVFVEPEDQTGIDLEPETQVQEEVVEEVDTEKTKKWKFTLSPTDNKYIEPDIEVTEDSPIITEPEPQTNVVSEVAVEAEEEEEEVQEATKEVAAEVVQKPERQLRDLISTLEGNRYIQISSYKSLDYAKSLLTETRSKLGEMLGNKTVIYKPENSSYYKLVVGPFQITEIGVNLYKLRKLGFSDAFTIK